MPLRDHFRPPLDKERSWDELHGMWLAVIVQHLIPTLPEGYFAAPGVHLGTIFEVDVATFSDEKTAAGQGGVPAGAPPAGGPARRRRPRRSRR